MRLSWRQIEGVVTELGPKIVGGRIQKIRQPDPATLCMSVYLRGETTHVIVSVTPRGVRFSESESQGPTIETPTALGMWMRKHAQGRRLTALDLHQDDRILHFGLAEGTLIAELFGRTANLFGIDVEGVLRCSARGIRPPLKLGDVYGSPVSVQSGAHLGEDKPLLTALQVEGAFQVGERTFLVAQEEQAVRRLLKSARGRLKRRMTKIEADIQRCAMAESLLKQGELLKGQLHKVIPKADEVILDDWYTEGMPPLVLALDPRLDGAGNLERLFKRYRKARDGAVRAEMRFNEAKTQGEKLERYTAEGLEADVLRDRLRGLGLVGPQQVRGATRKTTRKPYHEFRSSRGERILVGRGGVDNHQTTFHVAKGNDFWLHTRDCPGAHVIVPCPNRNQSPHAETIKDAAALAIHHSRLRGEPGVAVSQTQRKHLRPVKGGAPGRVTVASAKTVYCHDIESRIHRLYTDQRTL